MATTPRKQREVRQRELHLLDVARTMLIAQGYAGLSMDRLAEATEYSKGTIYQHFSTKEDLVMALASQSMEQRLSLFERAASFRGRPRERLLGIGIADELFARLYPHAFRSELIIKMANLEERASPERTDKLRTCESECTSLLRNFIKEAIAIGDLAPTVSVPQVMFALLTLVLGTHTVVANFRPLLTETQVTDPYSSLRESIQVLLDGFGWKPLSTEWDYAETYRRIAQEVFADECQSAGPGSH
ncbi:TetR/AcrR family transcriptional regulator [Singulisphaera acidiphila]|uniref:Transcriptional regulator n=1 Tax=Singulisphaera acidiphila (strain ATCC BAA-1392 / DSM 18658 / VKM B-2454 / MOB10) TaxID=886293 RepID=L0DFB6_SINAD|nr:TetR/AcrR family transcriptional regulator [Singulisphaera acidiphila]AGA28074.1 transcriptional regulator [Singulisphaera acidiphila DSM 18658]